MVNNNTKLNKGDYNTMDYGNNNNNDIKVNTYLPSMFGETAMLSMQYSYNKFSHTLFINLSPVLAVTGDGKKQYNTNVKVMTSISTVKAVSLLKEIRKYGDNKEFSISVPMKNTLLCINRKINGDNVQCALSVYTRVGNEIDMNKSATYVFNNSDIIVDFSIENSTGVTVSSPSEYDLFICMLEQLTKMPGSEHPSKVNKTVSDKFSKSSSSNNSYTMGNIDNEVPF